MVRPLGSSAASRGTQASPKLSGSPCASTPASTAAAALVTGVLRLVYAPTELPAAQAYEDVAGSV
ncbi:hypothetical protein [Pseudokineococcus basanitobsidens]|uniref:hypothetical protein n=1 Tax=Pseudokineococcus basanitobsidens TaxID=1926649 RepID=UPI0030D70276